MRMRRYDEPNRALVDLLLAAIPTGLMVLIRFLAKEIKVVGDVNMIFRAISEVPLYGVLMIAVFLYIANREKGGRTVLHSCSAQFSSSAAERSPGISSGSSGSCLPA